MERAEDEVPGERGLNRGPRRLFVADFTDHDHIGVLSQERPECLGERQPDLLSHLKLVDQGQVVLDRVLDRADIVFHAGDFVQCGIQRRRLAASGRSGDEHDPVGSSNRLLERRQNILGEPEIVEVEREVARVEHADDGLFAVVAGKGTDAEVDFSPFEQHMNASVLRQPAFADVHRGHDLDAACDGAEQVLGNFQRLVEPAVDPVTDPDATLGRFDVDVARAFLDRVVNDVVHQPDDGRLAGDLFGITDLFDRVFDEREVGLIGVFDDVIDDEDVGVRKRGEDAPNIFGRRRNDLHLLAGQPAHFVDKEHVRRFDDGDGERVADAEERQHEVFFDVVSWQQVGDGRVAQPWFELGIGNAHHLGQALDDLLFRTILVGE